MARVWRHWRPCTGTRSESGAAASEPRARAVGIGRHRIGFRVTQRYERGRASSASSAFGDLPRRTLDSAAKADLAGTCDGATHIVRDAKIGAFAFGAGTKGEANVAIEILGRGGVEKNEAEGQALLTKSCDGGDLPACDDLGVLHAEGVGVPRTPDKAKALFEKACTGSRFGRGCVHLGELYEKGGAVTKDATPTLGLYERSCPGLGCFPAAALYESGRDGTRKDLEKAAVLYERGGVRYYVDERALATNRESCAKAGALIKDKTKLKKNARPAGAIASGPAPVAAGDPSAGITRMV